MKRGRKRRGGFVIDQKGILRAWRKSNEKERKGGKGKRERGLYPCFA